jgi:hypothetical protein
MNLIQQKSWCILWGVLTPILFILELLSVVLFREIYVMLFFEFLPAAFFGLWIFDRNNFKENSLKFIFVLIVFCFLIYYLEIQFAWISVFLIIAIMNYINFGKKLFFLSFGLMMLYVFLGIIFILSILFLNNFDATLTFYSFFIGGFETIIIILFALILKGIIFGYLVNLYYNKYINIEKKYKGKD